MYLRYESEILQTPLKRCPCRCVGVQALRLEGQKRWELRNAQNIGQLRLVTPAA